MKYIFRLCGSNLFGGWKGISKDVFREINTSQCLEDTAALCTLRLINSLDFIFLDVRNFEPLFN